MSNDIEKEIKHLEMWADDLRRIIANTQERGTALEKGFPLFLLVKNRLEIEVKISELKKELK